MVLLLFLSLPLMSLASLWEALALWEMHVPPHLEPSLPAGLRSDFALSMKCFLGIHCTFPAC